MLYIISQDRLHHSSGAITLKDNTIIQDGIVIGTYNTNEKAKMVFENIISAHFKQNATSNTTAGYADCIFQMPQEEKAVVEEVKAEVKEEKPKATPKPKTATKKVGE